MSNVRVDVHAPGEIYVPDTGMLTAITNNNSGSNTTFYLGIGVIIAVFLAVVLPVVFIKKRNIKINHDKLSLFSRKKFAYRIMFLALLSFGVTFSALGAIENNTNGTNAIDGNRDDILTITTENINIDVELDDEPAYVSVPNKVTVNNKVMGGYTLSVYADTKDLISTTDDNNKISGLNGVATTLSKNSWGMSLTAPENQGSTSWRAIPTSLQDAVTIKTTTEEATDHDETTVYYGVYLTPDFPQGTYTGVINYVAVANVVTDGLTVNYHGGGLYFDEEKTIDANTVVYANACRKEYVYVGEQYQVSHTSNIDDAGNQDGGYTDDEVILQPFVIDGAEKIKVDINYNVSSEALVAIIEGNWDGSSDPEHYQLLEGQGEGSYIFDGPSVTMLMESWGVVEENHNYGYYAKIYPAYNDKRDGTKQEVAAGICKWQAVQGEYKEPIIEEGLERSKWSGNLPDLGTFSFANEEELLQIITGFDPGAHTLNGAMLNADTVIYGDYTLTYDANGGEFVCATQQEEMTIAPGDASIISGVCEEAVTSYTEVVGNGEVIVLFDVTDYTPSREGFLFRGWSTDPNSDMPMYLEHDNFSHAVGNITLYAVWSHYVELSYSVDGRIINKQAIPSNSASTVNNYYSTNRVFLGWNTKQDGSGINYAQYAIYSVGDLDENQTVILYAQFGKGVTISFSANGGSGRMSSQLIPEGSSAILNGNTYSYGGHNFLGWNTSADGLGASYADKSVYSVGELEADKTVILYAQWDGCDANEICYKSKGDDMVGVMKTQIVASNEETTISAPELNRTGYGLAGWSEDPNTDPNDDSAVIYGPNQTIMTGDLSANGLELYAVWVPENELYTMQSFDIAEFEAANPNIRITALRNEANDRTYAVAKLDDGNWWMIENLSATKQTLESARAACPSGWGLPSSADYADLNSSLGGIGSSIIYRSFPYNFTYTRTSPSGEPSGTYWLFTYNTTPVDVFNFSDNSASMGDDLGESELGVYNYHNPMIRCVTPSVKLSYDFNGGSVNYTYYYNIKAHTNGKFTIPMLDSSHYYNNVPKKDGYSFLGWATSSDATVPEYQPGETVVFAQDTVLYAVYELL